nr:platelet binding protein GspB-like [Dermacentor andersoni]
MGATSVAACAVMLAICLPAVCQGQPYWGGYGWRPVWQPSVSAVCDRAYPVNEASAVRTTCRYPCQGWPVRYGNEEDGTPCQLSWWRQGFCFRGRCQRQYLAPAVQRDEDNNVEGRQDPVRFLMCRNRRERVKVGGVVRSCQFVCKQRRNSFLANEDNGTPCLAWGGNVGYCDQGTCKAVEPTAAPTAAQTTSTEQSTTPQLPVASSAAPAVPAATAQATEDDVALVQTSKPTAAVTAAATQAPATAAPAARPPWRPGFVGVKCDRAYPARVSNGHVAKCRFLCRGYPSFGIGFEEDGTPCWRKKTLEGVCLDGKCKPVVLTTAATTVQQERTTTVATTTNGDAVTATEAGEEPTTQLAADTEGVETISTSTTSAVQEGGYTNAEQGTSVSATESTTVNSEFVTTEQQVSSSDEQATTANSAPAADDEAHTEDNVSEPAPAAETAVYETTENNTGHSVEDVTITQDQTTGDSLPKGTAAPEDATDIAGSEHAGTPSGDEVTTHSEREGKGDQQTTAAGQITGEDEEGSGNIEELSTSKIAGDEVTITPISSTEETVTLASVTDTIIVDPSTQSASEGSADDEVKLQTEGPQTSQPSIATTGSQAASEGDVEADDASSPTETQLKTESSTSAVTEGVLEEVTKTQNPEKEVTVDVTEATQENPSTTPTNEGEDGDRAVTEVVSSEPADVEHATATSHAVISDIQQEVTEGVTLATTRGATEATTAAGETATAKIITVVTRKEIVRPVGPDADQSDATVVDSTRSTYVETVPLSQVNETVASSTAESVVSVSSDNPGVAPDETNTGVAASTTVGVFVNEPEVVATTALAVEAAQPEEIVTELPETKAASVRDETTEETTVEDESATVKSITTITRKEITRPIDGDASQPEVTSVDAQGTTSVETLPLSEVDKTSASDPTDSAVAESSESVSDSPDHTGAAVSVSGDPTASATSSTEEASQVLQDVTEVSSIAAANEVYESTTAAAESATVKVITTITHKEIVRPIGSDDSQSDANVVDSSKTTSVETLPASQLEGADKSSPAESEVPSPSETSVQSNEDAAASDAVSSRPSIVITDFVQKTASSSKDSVTAPSTEEQATTLL